ncbi:MAG: tRNA U34 5-carboxymethylaminomethyl modifying GTPase MnmE/TrmE [Candidatus Alkanophagales archaeon MCA70_species_1]|nr:tRNA U34 5-carboxymethylaminomethyl modifying GTPase MnmE/TrmE [Candidatus Alkanophaga volatiphilum]
MGLRRGLLLLLRRILRRRNTKIGIYGAPNAGKTTLANRIIHDFLDNTEDIGVVSEIPHETRRAFRKEGILITAKGAKLRVDIVDTPGLATKIDFHDFLAYGLSEEEAKKRAKEATEGVIEAIKWLDDLDGVLLVMDATEDPYTQANIVIIGNLEARGIPFIIVANKVDLKNAAPARIKNAFPQHVVVPVSALKGDNMEKLYEEMARRFR